MREDILQALSELIKEKTELKAEKVELGLVDDIENSDKKLAKLWDNSNKNIDSISDLDDKVEQLQKKAESLLKNLKSDSSKMSKERENATKLIKNFTKAAKELGVNINEVPAITRLNKRLDESYQHNETIKDWIRVATQITKI